MKLGIIDAQWVMRRNKEAMNRGNGINYKELISSFMSSIAKMCNESDVTNPVLVFDKGPYLKEEYITLKTSRYYPSESERQSVPEGATPEEITKIEAQNKALDYRLQVEEEFRHAKNFVIKYMRNIGFPVVAIKGYEADDLAFHIANNLGIKHPIRFISIDSDWKYLMGPNTQFYRQNRAKEFYDSKTMDLNPKGIPLQEYGALLALLSGNHNDIEVMNLGKSFDEVVEAYRMNKLEELLGPKYEEFMIHFNAVNCNYFFTEELKTTLLEQLKPLDRVVDKTDIWEFSSQFGIKLNVALLSNVLAKRDLFSELLDEPIIEFPKEI